MKVIKVILLTASLYVTDIRNYNIKFSVLSRSGVKGRQREVDEKETKKEAEGSGLYSSATTQATAYLKKTNHKKVCFIYWFEFIRFC